MVIGHSSKKKLIQYSVHVTVTILHNYKQLWEVYLSKTYTKLVRTDDKVARSHNTEAYSLLQQGKHDGNNYNKYSSSPALLLKNKCLKKINETEKFPPFSHASRDWPLVSLWLCCSSICFLWLRTFFFPREPRGTQVTWCSSCNIFSWTNNRMPIIKP